jgi:glutathione synthase/RimK-type ligase-like ATP-grasp enzyme
VRCGRLDLDLSTVTAAYMRPYSSMFAPEVRATDRESAEMRHAAEVDDLLLSWAQMTPALVVNRPGAGASNGSKPRQSALIAAHGLATPATLVTNDVGAAREFVASHGCVIYKSLSGVRSIVTQLTERDLSRFDAGMACPVQLQAYVAGVDVRVHVVGDAVHATEIASAADDYRYAARDGHDVAMRHAQLPDELAELCRSLTAALGLVMSGIDLRRQPDGSWCCFEVNPSPAFTFFDSKVAGAIADDLVGVLASGGPHAEVPA